MNECTGHSLRKDEETFLVMYNMLSQRDQGRILGQIEQLCTAAKKQRRLELPDYIRPI